MECLLLFGPELFVFLFTIQKFNDYNIQNCNLHLFLYGCETWSLTLREERRVRLSENRVLRRMFGPKREEVTGEGRKLQTGSLMICITHPIFFG